MAGELELVPKDSFPTLSSIFVETLCRSSVENGLFRQSFPTKDSDKDSASVVSFLKVGVLLRVRPDTLDHARVILADKRHRHTQS